MNHQVGIIPYQVPSDHNHSVSGQGGQLSWLNAILNKPAVDVREFAAVADRVTVNTVAVQNAIDSLPANGGVIYIPKDVQYDYPSLTHPADVFIHDDSGWDWALAVWNGESKFITNATGAREREFHVTAPYHPAVILNNEMGGGAFGRASFGIRQDGADRWQMGRIDYGGDFAFRFRNTLQGRDGIHINEGGEMEMGFGDVYAAGIGAKWYSYITGDYIHRYRAATVNDSVMFQIYKAGTHTWTVHYDDTTDIVRFINVATSKEFNILPSGIVYAEGISFNPSTELTIAGGVISVTKSYHRIDGQGDAADDLVTINGGVDGMILILQSEHVARAITVKSTGNIDIAATGDFVMTSTRDRIIFIYDGLLSTWCEISRSAN